MKKHTIIAMMCIGLMAASCATVNPGEVGVKQTFGRLNGGIKESGLIWTGLFSNLITVPTRTINKEVKLNLPSKEGLNVKAEISILYHVQKNKVIDIINEIGLDYERVLILSAFRSASADVCAQFFAKDMHSGRRDVIEQDILRKMQDIIGDRGFIIENVLMKSISLPDGLYSAIEAKLQAEQQAQQMEFVLDREKMEAERKRVEAEGIRDAQKIIKEGITEENIKWRSLEVFQELSNSQNAKIIITNGETPMLINSDASGGTE